MNAKKLLALGAIMGSVPMAFAAANDITQLDIVIRDFQPNHPDFENVMITLIINRNYISIRTILK